MARLKVTEFIKGKKLEAIEKKARDPKDILNAIGVLVTRNSVQSFRTQKRGPFRWRERKLPNIAGSIADLNRGANPPERRFKSPRPALIDTGRMRASITHRIKGKDEVKIGTNVGYGKIHQKGGRSRLLLTKSGQKKLKKYLRSPKGRKHQGELGFLFRKPKLSIKIPKRPFILVTKQERRQIGKLIQKAFAEPQKDVSRRVR